MNYIKATKFLIYFEFGVFTVNSVITVTTMKPIKVLKEIYCSVRSCEYYSGTKMIKMFEFPKDFEQNKIWRNALQISENNYCRGLVCLNHFNQKDIRGGKTPKLRKGAVPTVPTVRHVLNVLKSPATDKSPFVATVDEQSINELSDICDTRDTEMAESSSIGGETKQHVGIVGMSGKQRNQREVVSVASDVDFVDVVDVINNQERSESSVNFQQTESIQELVGLDASMPCKSHEKHEKESFDSSIDANSQENYFLKLEIDDLKTKHLKIQADYTEQIDKIHKQLDKTTAELTHLKKQAGDLKKKYTYQRSTNKKLRSTLTALFKKNILDKASIDFVKVLTLYDSIFNLFVRRVKSVGHDNDQYFMSYF